MRLVKLNDKCYECDDYRPIVEQFIPEILKLIDIKEDQIIQEKFLGRMIAISEEIDKIGEFRTTVIGRTFSDVILDAIENNVRAQELLKFINNCIKEVSVSLSGALTNKIKKIVHNMISNETGSGFYTSTAELACLSEILKNGKLKINDIERKLSNGKSVDMVIEYDGGDLFVDVVSIFFDEGKIYSNEDMYQFLYGRISKKYGTKFQSLENVIKDCGILPVLWGDLIEFKQYEVALEKLLFEYKNQIIPFYGLVYQNNGYFFRPIENIVRKINL